MSLRSGRLAAKPRAANATAQAQKVLMVKMGLATSVRSVDSEAFKKFECLCCRQANTRPSRPSRMMTSFDDFVSEVQDVEVEAR